jgi:DNA-binding CsgD family transcriptional regulator
MPNVVQKATNTITSHTPTPDAGWLWQARALDSAMPIFVVDRHGIVESANAQAIDLLRPDAGGVVVGRSLSALLGQEQGQERMHHVHDAMATGRTILYDEMRRGRLWRCSLRAIPSPTGCRSVLVVAHLASLVQALGQSQGTVLKAKNNDAGKLSDLTARELEILKLIGVGMSTLEIAKHLGRSVKTIEWHRVSLGEKLGVVNRVELARIAIAAGLVGLDEPSPMQSTRGEA